MQQVRLSPVPLFLLTLILSFCSIVYELILAQSMSATLGNSFLRYNVTIGLYLASLGAGALLCSKRKDDDLLPLLIDVEIALTLLGALSPLLMLFWDSLAFKAGARLYAPLAYAFDHALVVAIGLFSGYELPLLMRLGRQGSRDLSNEVLAVDYLGTLLGALCFPILLLPALGVLSAAALTALLNGLCALALLLFLRADLRRLALCGLGTALCLALLGARGAVELAATAWYLRP